MLAKMLRSLFENPINDFSNRQKRRLQWIINQKVSDILRSGQKLTSPLDLDFQDPWESKTSYCRSRKKIRGYTSQIEEQKCTILVFFITAHHLTRAEYASIFWLCLRELSEVLVLWIENNYCILDWTNCSYF